MASDSHLRPLAPDQRYLTWQGQRVCVVQKEYPTAHHLGKPQRQHWDIALLQNPPDHSQSTHVHTYDYLKLAAVVEFGLNENEAHLQDDIERLSHASANVERGYLVHLYRLSQPGAKFSGRDWAATSKQIVSKEQVAIMSRGRSVEIFYGMFDGTGRHENGMWRIIAGEIRLVGGLNESVQNRQLGSGVISITVKKWSTALNVKI